eukprot:CAMPEP_0172305404 /NCGR_PEP_ID=MMETSP1058-20130122/6708_1 /TAXON_ID=83371 /ORGANISM="Detonula confervacea, Strain CCMP 353" /LENGTH=602 /DNA_ID=CAMNT_0013016999 /DNA_START=58 /DNA_END=1866 /DNA_ORIENTATION=-
MATSSSTSHRRWASALIIAAITVTTSSFPLRPNSRVAISPGRSHACTVQLHSSPNADNESTNSSVSDRRSRRKPRLPDKNLYETLGANPNMSRSAIKRLYITLAKETHPDASNNNNSVDDADRFNEIAQAWTILSDSQTRRSYDRELAAQDFKEDIVKKAGEVAREYGPTARKFYDDYAIPFLRRTTATTLAGWSAVTEVTSEVASASERAEGGNNGATSRNNELLNGNNKLAGVTLSEVVKEVSEMERTNVGAGGLEDFGRAFQRVVKAGEDAARQIDVMELQEKSMELRKRADETRTESMQVLEQLTDIKSERLRLTFHTSSANFTSTDAMQYLGGFTQGIPSDEVTLMQRMTFKHPIQHDVEAFNVAESDFDRRVQEKSELDQELLMRQRAFVEAENNARAAIEAEERARKMLEDAQNQVTESQRMVAEAHKSIRDIDGTVKKADQELNKANTMLKRKRDVVRRELKRKAEKVAGSMFDQVDNGKVRLNPGFDRSSSMNVMGFEKQSIATIEALTKDEKRVEGDFLRLVEKASRLVSRSERLRLRSEEMIGEQQHMPHAQTNSDQAALKNAGDTFEGVSDEMMDAAQISNAFRRNAKLY